MNFIYFYSVLFCSFFSIQIALSQNLLYSSDPKSLDKEIRQVMQEAHIPALSLAYFEGNKIKKIGAYGYRNLYEKDSIDINTIFSAASLSKVLFSYIILQLVEEGKLNLDTPISSYYDYPDFKHLTNTEDKKRVESVTTRMLLTHQTGLPNWRNGNLNFEYSNNNQFHYSGEGFMWLQKTVEHITGKNLEKLAQERVFIPLEMKNTSYEWQQYFEENYALPHNKLSVLENAPKWTKAGAAYSLQTTAEDYAKFLMAICNHQGLSKEMVEKFLTPQIIATSSNDAVIEWGLGVGLQTKNNQKQFWHWGDNGAFKAYFVVSPHQKNGLVYFANSRNGLSITPKITSFFMENEQTGWEWQGYQYYKETAFHAFYDFIETDFDAAIKNYSIKKNKNFIRDTTKLNEQIMNKIGEEFINQRRFEEAKKSFYSNLKFYLNSINTYQNLGLIALKEGNNQKAIEFYEKSLEQETDKQNSQRIEKIINQLTQPQKGAIIFRLSSYQNAKMISLVGNFNDWNETSNIFQKEKGKWICKIDLDKGNYDYKFIIDGVWIIDPINKTSKHTGTSHVSVLEVE
ncbi:serine hydrolase [Bernardetia sp. OM2101]|uniref:serine hydrolase n=1 Tax=Bernardetia sp. OM2101 TaxID=3344876 RepID=UPI0035CEC2C1